MLSHLVADFIRLRRAGGFKYEGHEILLSSFARFASERGEEHIVAETAIDWAAQGTSPEARETRLRMVVAFARHCRAEDALHQVPPKGVFGNISNPKRPVAYVFSCGEILSILAASKELHPQTSLRPRTYYTLFGLLAATGLRIGEALRLCENDIQPVGLSIRETKFRKSRIVPIHSTTSHALRRYMSLRGLIGGSDPHVFVGLKGQPLLAGDVRHTFHQIITKLGLSQARKGLSPRLHDFRHTWAVRALESCPDQVNLIGRHVRAVTTYLGHVSVATGYWYLHATPVLMKRIADACASAEEGSEA